MTRQLNYWGLDDILTVANHILAMQKICEGKVCRERILSCSRFQIG